MTEEEFWNCTHRKLLALLSIHKKINDAKYNSISNNEVEEDYIDNIIL